MRSWKGKPSAGEVARFRSLVASDPACLELYRQQMEIDVLLTVTGACGGSASRRHVQPVPARRPRVRLLWKRVAAAAALLLAGAGLWYGVPRLPSAASRPRPSPVPPVSPVTMVEWKWPWSKLVDIDYVLSGAPQGMDIAVSAFNGPSPLPLTEASLTGDRFSVSDGARRIVWDPTVTACTNLGVLGQFRVALTPTPVPLYMIIDLTKNAGVSNQIEYVYEEDLTNGHWGAWVRNPVTNLGTVVESVVWTGVATNDLYKTDKLVLRRVPAGSFQMGDTQTGTPNVTLTKGMYVGIFEVTQRQWELVMGGKPSYFDYATRPLESRSYDDIRGATNSTPSIDWPTTRYAVAPDSFLGQLRGKTGLTDFDLPTAAQWEYLCRAGTTTYYNDGLGTPSNTTSNEQVNALCRYAWNGGKYWDGDSWKNATSTFGPTNGTAIVGSYAPNAWGLYDTHGNVWEWCLDWRGTTPIEGSDPVGPNSGSSRWLRGGCWFDSASGCRSASRNDNAPSSQNQNYHFGFRLIRNLP